MKSLLLNALIKFTLSSPIKLSLHQNPQHYEVLEVIDEGNDIKTRGPPVLGNIIRDTFYRWPTTTIPIEIGSDLNMKGVAAVRDAMYNYGMRTCINLVPWNGKDYPYISIYPIGGCFSHVGWGFPAQQNISIGSGCEVPGKVQHEIFHALGAYHTHSSPERDEYVNINWYNIQSGKEHNFDVIHSKNYRSAN